MAETVQQLVDDVVNEGSFDVTPAQALRWLNRRHRVMVVESRSSRRTVSIGPTVAGQRDYALPVELVQIYEVLVGGTTYTNGRHQDLSLGANGFLVLDGEGGIVSPEETSTGAAEIALYPTPEKDGDTLEVRGAFLPADLSTSDDSTLRVPGDFADALVAGAIATGLRRIEGRPDLAQSFEQEFADGVARLKTQTMKRYRGPGVVQIRVAGVNA
jgi:hypothetical protein